MKFQKFDLNFVDNMGNSPLMLAAKLAYSHIDYYQIFEILLKNGACPKFNDLDGNSILDILLGQADIVLISKLFDALNSRKKEIIENEINILRRKLCNLPDFYLEMKWEFDSDFIPFIKRIAPSGQKLI